MTIAEDGSVSAAGGLLVASAFFPWTAHGTGSSMRGYELANFALSRPGGVWIGAARWLALVLYLVPITGAVALTLVGARRSGKRVRAGALMVGSGVAIGQSPMRTRSPR